MKTRIRLEFTDGTTQWFDWSTRQPEGVLVWDEQPLNSPTFFFPWVRIKCLVRERIPEEEKVS